MGHKVGASEVGQPMYQKLPTEVTYTVPMTDERGPDNGFQPEHVRARSAGVSGARLRTAPAWVPHRTIRELASIPKLCNAR